MKKMFLAETADGHPMNLMTAKDIAGLGKKLSRFRSLFADWFAREAGRSPLAV